MALHTRSNELKRVPWFSLAEWYDVYKKIYSNDTQQQTRGYEMLLVWKGRISKLPVGIECTLSLIQVCLRDRSWSRQINSGALPMYHENDLSLMYSTTIMRFLNHISNIGPTKQTSLFQIAKQLRIPEWIVNLRHDTAHGHELPSITLLRMATNVLLTWLYEEYWAPEAQALDQALKKQNEMTEMEVMDSLEGLVDLIQLWMSVGLYMESGLSLVSHLPDEHLRNTLKDFDAQTCTNMVSKRHLDTSILSEHGELEEEDTYRLKTARSHLLIDITNQLYRCKDHQKSLANIITNVLINSQVFLVSHEILELFSRKCDDENYQRRQNLPRQLIAFWQPMISLIHEAKLLEALTFKLIEVVNCNDGRNSSQMRECASLWLKTIGQSFLKLKIAHKEGEKLEHSQEGSKKTPQRAINKKLEGIINTSYRELRDCPWLGVNSHVPRVFTDERFSEEVIMNANQYTAIFIGPYLELISPEMNAEKKSNLLDFLRIQSAQVIYDNDNGDYDQVVHTVQELMRICGEGGEMVNEDESFCEASVRNSLWQLAPGNFNWRDCAFGILPWQANSLDILGSTGWPIQPEVVCSNAGSEIVAGILDDRGVSRKRVNWESVLRNNQKGTRKRRRRRRRRREEEEKANKVMDRAIQIIKSRKVLR
ncbi:uncharacterized protein LOC107036947 [Diachasma alloeum]|uniref:uncharacterized protein LOC107036947 n=1 Tax=Diachasma alloeum TaxID=454923 RepID=UPI000738130B|nr:uncharacterized protein LOC107036947 [Diachasma alloeum]